MKKDSKLGSKQYKYSDITQRIIGCAMEIHNTLGNGFQEVIYQRALAQELGCEMMQFKREVEIPVIELANVHLAQAINYLEAYNLEIGLLINFGNTRLQFHRLENKKFEPE